MTNIDRAAEVLSDWADSEGGLASIDRDYDGDLTGGAEDLADAGLLIPDLPEPTRWKQNEEPEWDACETTISPVGYEGRVLVEEEYDRWEASSANIRALALALLAAADYAERNQE